MIRAASWTGLLQLAGRAGDIAITGGHKVSLPEVERAFETYDNLGEVCAIALDDPALGSIIVLVIETGPGTPGPVAGTARPIINKAALFNHARTHLAPQFVPRRIYRLEQLPRTVGGKIRRAGAPLTSSWTDRDSDCERHPTRHGAAASSSPVWAQSPPAGTTSTPCGNPSSTVTARSACSKVKSSRIWRCASAAR